MPSAGRSESALQVAALVEVAELVLELDIVPGLRHAIGEPAAGGGRVVGVEVGAPGPVRGLRHERRGREVELGAARGSARRRRSCAWRSPSGPAAAARRPPSSTWHTRPPRAAAAGACRPRCLPPSPGCRGSAGRAYRSAAWPRGGGRLPPGRSRRDPPGPHARQSTSRGSVWAAAPRVASGAPTASARPASHPMVRQLHAASACATVSRSTRSVRIPRSSEMVVLLSA